MSTCRNGHPLSKVGMIWTGDHFQCHACRRESVRAAQLRYVARNPGQRTASTTLNNAKRRLEAHGITT